MLSLPWAAINELVLEAGTATDRIDAENRFMEGLGQLIPNEAGIGVFDACTRCIRHTTWPSSTIHEYNQRYSRQLPWIQLDSGHMVCKGSDIVRLADYSQSAFMNDFARPNNMGQGLNPYRPGLRYNFAVQRSRSEPLFTTRDCAILDQVNRHYNNILTLFDRIGESQRGLPEADTVRWAFPNLTKREAEILALMASGLTMGEASTKIMISPRTLEVHLQHIREKMGVPTTRRAVRVLLERLGTAKR